MPDLTPSQVAIIREAIGLNKSNTSLGNYYVSQATDDLNAIVAAGLMICKKRDPVFGGYGKKMFYYMVTPDGARAVLRPGEKLDKRDFPRAALQRQLQL